MPSQKLNLSALARFVRVHVIMSTGMYERLVHRCVKEQRPMYALVEDALRDYLAEKNINNSTKKER